MHISFNFHHSPAWMHIASDGSRIAVLFLIFIRTSLGSPTHSGHTLCVSEAVQLWKVCFLYVIQGADSDQSSLCLPSYWTLKIQQKTDPSCLPLLLVRANHQWRWPVVLYARLWMVTESCANARIRVWFVVFLHLNCSYLYIMCNSDNIPRKGGQSTVHSLTIEPFWAILAILSLSR